jgi:hypothetical protein
LKSHRTCIEQSVSNLNENKIKEKQDSHQRDKRIFCDAKICLPAADRQG